MIFFPIIVLISHIICAIHTCSPQVSQHTAQGGECPWRADPQLLKMALSTYPKLKFALFPPTGPFGMGLSDVSVYHLMQVLLAKQELSCQLVCMRRTGHVFIFTSKWPSALEDLFYKCYKLLAIIYFTLKGWINSAGLCCVCLFVCLKEMPLHAFYFSTLRTHILKASAHFSTNVFSTIGC